VLGTTATKELKEVASLRAVIHPKQATLKTVQLTIVLILTSLAKAQEHSMLDLYENHGYDRYAS
jgi:hypothetical protein